MKTNQTFSILFWLYKSKAKNGKTPIYCRISINGQRTEIATKRSIDPEKWNAASGNAKGNSEEARTLNTFLAMMKNELLTKYNYLAADSPFISPDMLKNEYLGVREVKMTVLGAFKYHNDKMEERIGIDVVKETHDKFETIYSKLEFFIQSKYFVKDLFFPSLTHKFIVDFEHFLRTYYKIGHNTTMKYIQNFKKIVTLSISNGWLDKNPFVHFKCTQKPTNRLALRQDELRDLENKKFIIPRIEEVRDIFLFCCYTGLSFIDVFRLSEDDLTIGIDGNLWIYTYRKKTGTKSNVPLLPQAIAILEKYKKHPAREIKGKLLPVKSNQKMNAYLHEIADFVGIKKPLTMHIARHTFATTVTLSNGVPIETVSLMLGHTKLATTQIYAKVLETKVSEDMIKLQEKLLLKSV